MRNDQLQKDESNWQARPPVHHRAQPKKLRRKGALGGPGLGGKWGHVGGGAPALAPRTPGCLR